MRFRFLLHGETAKTQTGLRRLPGPLLLIPYTALYNPQEYTTRTPTFDPKILEKMDFGYIDRTSNSAF